jgi:pimeloyl-ACP methyl ester carboxylesterase
VKDERERYVRAGSVRARVIESGEGEPVLLIHGVGGFAENWRPTMEALASSGFRPIACDLPGFGRSERARRARYFDPQEPYYARFIAELLDALDIESADVVGHSLGGAVAAVSAISFPERVRRLILVAPGGFGTTLASSFRMFSLPLLDRLAPFVSDRLIRDVVCANFADPSCAPDWLFDDAVRYSRAGGAAEFARVLRTVVTLRGVRPELIAAWEERGATLRSPALVVWGRLDRVLPVEHAQAAIARIPNARLEIIEDAGHLVMLERPKEFARALLAFLR